MFCSHRILSSGAGPTPSGFTANTLARALRRLWTSGRLFCWSEPVFEKVKKGAISKLQLRLIQSEGGNGEVDCKISEWSPGTHIYPRAVIRGLTAITESRPMADRTDLCREVRGSVLMREIALFAIPSCF